MSDPVGPVYAGGFEEFVIQDEAGEGHTLLFLPDRNNDALQRERKAPVFYYIPEKVRLARNAATNDFKFRHIHFVGVFDESTAGIEKGETSGGVLSLTTTSRFPPSVLKQAEAQILERFSGRNDKYWGLRSNTPPQIRIAPITANQTVISSLAPDASGATPNIGGDAGGGNPAPTDGGEPGVPEGPRSRDFMQLGSRSAWAPVPHGREFRGTQLDAWAWRIQGSGPGSITGGENAYGGVIGPIPSEIVWAGFHGTYSPLFVTQNLVMPMWSQLMRVKITGSWDRIFQHFSAHMNARYLWFSADIKAEFNNLRIKGDIKVEVDIDGTMPGAQEMEKMINQRIDMIVQQFTEQAKKVIFDPPPPQVEPAQASSSGGGIFGALFGYGAGVALKFRRDETQLNLAYEETRYFRYNQPHTISSSLEGFYNEIKNDPKAEGKYFQRLVLGELSRKLFRIVKPVVNWPDKARNWAGEPVAFVSAQVGYPDSRGSITWKPTTFQKSDSPDITFRPVWIQWRKGEVSNPPASWEPDATYMKRKIHLLEPPTESEFPFFHIDVEQNVIDLDPGANGTLSNDNIMEARADSAGTLDVGPIALSVELQSTAEIIEVEMRAKGQRADGKNRADKVTRFRFLSSDQLEPRFWRIYTGQNDFKTDYQYRVNVTVRGTLTTKGQAWTGPWENAIGNGAIMINVPMADDPGVTKRALTQREMFSDAMVRAAEGLDTGAGGSGAGTVAPPSIPETLTAGGAGVPPPPPGVTAQPPVAVPGQPVSATTQPPSGQPVPPRERPVSTSEVSGYRVGADSVEGFREDDDYGSAARTGKGGGKGKGASRQPVPSSSGQDPEGWVNS
ncbi:hypothetical protein [Polaromonas sp.]|uniref:hypothetical protein n=1 Tax=Polaromonas sp. TaxID=1869339 RepID=UPI003BB7FBB1